MKMSNVISKFREILKDPAKIFFLTLILGVIISLVTVLFRTHMYRDVSYVYAYFAKEIGYGNWSDGWVGRVPMLNILLSGIIARTGIDAFKASLIVSCLFYILTLFPLRALLQRYLTPLQSAYGCLLYISAPKVIRFFTSGLLESSRTFFLITALLFYFLLAEHKKIKHGILLGLSLAGLTVARGEGAGIALAMLCGFPVFAVLKNISKPQKDLRQSLRAALFMLLFFLIGTAPFCTVNYVKYGYYVSDLRLAESLKLCRYIPHPAAEILKEKEVFSVKERVAEVAGDTVRGSYEVYLLFGILGAFLILKRRKWNWDYTCIAGVIILHTAIYLLIGSSYRYHLYIIPMCMMFTITGIWSIGEFIVSKQKKWPAKHYRCLSSILVLVCFALILGQIGNGLRNAVKNSKQEEIAIARWLKEYQKNHTPAKRLRIAACDFTGAVYYSGAYHVWSYKVAENQELYSNANSFDILIASSERKNILEYYPDLEEVMVPPELGMKVFKPKKIGGEKTK